MLFARPSFQLETERLSLRLPRPGDYENWTNLRRSSADFLQPWEPTWAEDHLTKRAFSNRIYWAEKSYKARTGLPLFLIRRSDQALLGAITLDNIRRGPAQAGTFGYWVGESFARGGYMSEAISALVFYAFNELGLSRIEAATLPENVASRGVLEKTGFKYEGVAQSYLQIAGRWRTHVLYAALGHDRRGRVS